MITTCKCHDHSLFLKGLETLIIPAQKFSTKFLPAAYSQLSNDMSGLFRFQKASTTLQSAELVSVCFTHTLVMHLPNLSLHFRVDNTWPNGDGGHIGFFHRKRQSKVVQHRFASTITAPALIGGDGGPGRGKNNPTL